MSGSLSVTMILPGTSSFLFFALTFRMSGILIGSSFNALVLPTGSSVILPSSAGPVSSCYTVTLAQSFAPRSGAECTSFSNGLLVRTMALSHISGSFPGHFPS